MTTPHPARVTIGHIISSVMIALGSFVLLRLLVRFDQPLTGTPMIDIAFGLFFIARGAVSIWTMRRRSRL